MTEKTKERWRTPHDEEQTAERDAATGNPPPLPPLGSDGPPRTDTLARLLDADEGLNADAPAALEESYVPGEDPKKTSRFHRPVEDAKSTTRFEKALFQGVFDDEPGKVDGASRAVPSLPAEEPPANDKQGLQGGTVPGYESQTSYTIGGRYLVEEGIAMGGMGAVFKVKHRGLGKHFALKIIHPQAHSDYEQLRAFEQEVQVLSRMDHPGIVQVTDFGLDERFGVFLVMEYLHGETLFDRLGRDRRLSVRVSLQIAMQIAEALHHMHGQGLVHRDVKPENVFLCRVPRDGRSHVQAKLIDFGLARPQIADAEIAESERAGTPEFAAPEQFKGSGPRPSMDIYALGVLLFEMLTGKLAFDGTLEEVIRRKLQSPPPSPNEHLDEPLDGSVVRLLTKSMAVDPALRHQTLSELIFELRTLNEMLGHTNRSRPGGGIAQAVRDAVEPQPDFTLSAADAASALSLTATPLPVCVVGGDRRILEANELFGQIVCLPPSQLRGEPVEDTLISTVIPDLERDLIEVLDSDQPKQRALPLDGKGGREHAHLWLVPFDGAHGPSVWMAILKI